MLNDRLFRHSATFSTPLDRLDCPEHSLLLDLKFANSFESTSALIISQHLTLPAGASARTFPELQDCKLQRIHKQLLNMLTLCWARWNKWGNTYTFWLLHFKSKKTLDKIKKKLRFSERLATIQSGPAIHSWYFVMFSFRSSTYQWGCMAAGVPAKLLVEHFKMT